MIRWRAFDDRLTFRRWLLLVTANLLLCVLCVIAMPTFLAWAGGAFTPRTQFESTSPDGRYGVAVTTRVDFPANEWLDPAILVGVTLSNAVSGEVLGSTTISLDERSDFRRPGADWTAGMVRVRDFEDRLGLTVTMKIPASTY